MFVPFASLLNAAVVAVTGLIGVRLGHRLPERVRAMGLAAIGLVTLVVGFGSALDSTNIVIPLLALAVGGMLGEALQLEGALERFAERLRARFAQRETGRFVEGFVTASLIATVGPLTIIGALSEGATGDRELILIKTALDAFMAFNVAAAYGIGVAFSALGILLVQVPITLLGAFLGDGFEGRVLTEFSATGGLILIAIGLRLLEVKRLPVASMLPALALAPLFLWIGERIVS